MPPPHSLAAGRLGGTTAGLIAVAAAAPLPAAAAPSIVPALASPSIFVAAGLLLLTFTAGCAAMTRRMPHVGPLYCQLTRGLGRPLGVGAAWLALASYQAIQLAMYGTLGVAAADWIGFGVTWWMAALGCWAIVAICGLLRISIVAGLLTLLVLASSAVLVRREFAWAALDPRPLADISRPALGALLVAGVLAFIGFETAAAYAEKARALYLPVLLLAILYPVAGIAAGAGLLSWVVTLGPALLAAGLLAGLIAVHQTIARYLFALGRERVLPGGLGRTGKRASAPWVASLTASVLAGAVIGGFAAAGLELPAELGLTGGLGILLLLPAVSLAALLFLNRNPNGEGAWSRFVAPGVATIGLGAVAYLALDNLTVPVAWVLAIPGVVLLGIVHGLLLRWAAPVTYAGLGLGGTAVVVAPLPPAVSPAPDLLLEVPRQREPGAHRPERVNRELSR